MTVSSFVVNEEARSNRSRGVYRHSSATTTTSREAARTLGLIARLQEWTVREESRSKDMTEYEQSVLSERSRERVGAAG